MANKSENSLYFYQLQIVIDGVVVDYDFAHNGIELYDLTVHFNKKYNSIKYFSSVKLLDSIGDVR